MHEQEEIRLYLLGLLPDGRRQALEERLLTDSALYEELLIAEDELIDRHLAGRLDERERTAFESHFMCAPERAQQVRFAVALRRYVADTATPDAEAATRAATETTTQTATEPTVEPDRRAEIGARRRAEIDRPGRGLIAWLRARNNVPAFSLTAAALLLVVGLSWMALRGAGTGRVVALTLTPDVHTRGGGSDIQSARALATADSLRLRLRLSSDDFPSYHATLLDAGGATILTDDSLKPESSSEGRIVVVNVPARSAPPGEYRLRLDGVNADGRSEIADSYRFTVTDR